MAPNYHPIPTHLKRKLGEGFGEARKRLVSRTGLSDNGQCGGRASNVAGRNLHALSLAGLIFEALRRGHASPGGVVEALFPDSLGRIAAKSRPRKHRCQRCRERRELGEERSGRRECNWGGAVEGRGPVCLHL